ncbi:MAG: LD-carboxypeptidase [Myxococcales bacterium]|nr:LD-carboxypeptidase [Myxococcales bacterium]
MRPRAPMFSARSRALGPGSRIAVIAPSSPFDRDLFDRGIARLRSRYDVHADPRVFETHGFHAGPDDVRLGVIHDALRDDSIVALVAARGGEGATRLLPGLDLDLVARARKLLVGFSDITALHAAWRRAGVASLHANVITSLGRGTDDDARPWFDAVEGHPPAGWTDLESLSDERAAVTVEGPLVGGNLAVLAALAGTPHALDAHGAIVCLEDVGERPYRIDRMLTTLLESRAFDGALGFVLGDFTGAEPGADGVTARDVLTERLGALRVPVFAGAPMGHGERNSPLPLGVRARLHTGSLEFLEACCG